MLLIDLTPVSVLLVESASVGTVVKLNALVALVLLVTSTPVSGAPFGQVIL